MAGLAAVRELRREGHDVTVLEQSGDVGGQWLYDPRRDLADPLSAEEPVKVHSSIYASLRLISARENMGFTDFHFAPKDDHGRDQRRFPGHREVYLYLKDFCDTFGLMEFVRLNTRVLRVAMQQPTSRCRQWAVRSVNLAKVETKEVFDAVVVANGHYSQPRVPSIQGMEAWSGRQMHSHSYRTRSRSGARWWWWSGQGRAARTSPWRSARWPRSCTWGACARTSGRCSATAPASSPTPSSTARDTTTPSRSWTRRGAVTVDDNRVGPLFEHVFPPSLAPSLSFIGIPIKVFAPWFFEAQAKWVALVLSGRRALPPEEEMLRSVEEWYRSREIAGVPKKYTHDVSLFHITVLLPDNRTTESIN
ncbi:hypothetical protein ACQ4PT_041739 [Festuca glaucescens]